MLHSAQTIYGNSLETYDGNLYLVKVKPPSQELGQANGPAPGMWSLVSTPMLNAIRKKGHRAVFKCAISKHSFWLVGYCFVDDTTIVQMVPRPDTPTEELVQIVPDKLDLNAGLAQATGGQVNPEKGKNN